MNNNACSSVLLSSGQLVDYRFCLPYVSHLREHRAHSIADSHFHACSLRTDQVVSLPWHAHLLQSRDTLS